MWKILCNLKYKKNWTHKNVEHVRTSKQALDY